MLGAQEGLNQAGRVQELECGGMVWGRPVARRPRQILVGASSHANQPFHAPHPHSHRHPHPNNLAATPTHHSTPLTIAQLDSARAALALPPAQASGLSPLSPVALAGYSQGGDSALFAGSMAPAYAPELNVVAVSGGGAITDPNKQLNDVTRPLDMIFTLLVRGSLVIDSRRPTGRAGRRAGLRMGRASGGRAGGRTCRAGGKVRRVGRAVGQIRRAGRQAGGRADAPGARTGRSVTPASRCLRLKVGPTFHRPTNATCAVLPFSPTHNHDASCGLQGCPSC